MSKMDQAKHKAEEIKGKVKEAAGNAVGNEDLKQEGALDQSKARAKQAVDNVKDAASDAKDSAKEPFSD